MKLILYFKNKLYILYALLIIFVCDLSTIKQYMILKEIIEIYKCYVFY